jgi:hypothetical protein
MINEKNESSKWCENVILVDGDYIDSIAFDLTVNFERMIGRPIQKADLAHWIDCIALDGGIRESENDVQVFFIYSKNKPSLEYFKPSHYETELNKMAFKDKFGEFSLCSFPAEDMISKDDFFIESLELIIHAEGVKRVMVIPNAEKIYNNVRAKLNDLNDEGKRITVFAMQPMPGGNFRQEILGYSLMSALGISADEINKN